MGKFCDFGEKYFSYKVRGPHLDLIKNISGLPLLWDFLRLYRLNALKPNDFRYRVATLGQVVIVINIIFFNLK